MTMERRNFVKILPLLISIPFLSGRKSRTKSIDMLSTGTHEGVWSHITTEGPTSAILQLSKDDKIFIHDYITGPLYSPAFFNGPIYKIKVKYGKVIGYRLT